MSRPIARTCVVGLVAAALVALPGLAGAGSLLVTSASAANPTP